MHPSAPPGPATHPVSQSPVPGQQPVFSAEVVGLLNDLRRAMAQNPQGAHPAAVRLVTLLTPPADAGQASKGGLAPWQKRKIDRYVRDHLNQRLHIHDLAKIASLSPSHFCRAFKHSFGAPPHAYIIRLRLQLAQRLMLTTHASLSQIAITCGMADQAHLSKLFRRGLGESPGAWRQRRLTDAQAEAKDRRRKASRSASPRC
jgi:AraC family transcriptional regulator